MFELLHHPLVAALAVAAALLALYIASRAHVRRRAIREYLERRSNGEEVYLDLDEEPFPFRFPSVKTSEFLSIAAPACDFIDRRSGALIHARGTPQYD